MNKDIEVIEIIAEVLNVDVNSITRESKAEDFQEWDSLAHVILIGALEEKLGITISLEQSMNIENVEQIIELCKLGD